jgi:site-specific recombinase XerD
VFPPNAVSRDFRRAANGATAELAIIEYLETHETVNNKQAREITFIQEDWKYHLRKPIEVSCETRPVCDKHYLHRLRKTCAARWLRNGIDLMTLRSWLGHKSLAVTQIYFEYVHNIDTSMQAKLDRAGSYSN